MTSRWAFVIGSALIAIPVVYAIGSSRRKRDLGEGDDIDPNAPTFNPQAVDESAPTEDPYAETLTADEGDCLILGRDHPFYKFGKYRVCLSPNQKKKLKPREKLGCGVFACAYTTASHGKVIKFTRDAEDVAALLEAQKLGVVPKVYDTYELLEEGESIKTGEKKPVYAIIVEKLRAFSPEERRSLDDSLLNVRDILYELKQSPEMSIQDACATVGQECGPITKQTIVAAQKLRSAGIDWTDIHSGNIGLDKKGNVKVLDLGITGTQLKQAPQILAGALRRLAKRRTIQAM